jgi:hypothetical protein
LLELLIKVNRHKLKTALYTGVDKLSHLGIRILGNLYYCKIGHYDDALGGLDKPTTNQRMFKWNWENSKWDDITYRFQKGYHNDSN